MVEFATFTEEEAVSRSLSGLIILELEPPNFIRLREKGRRKVYETTTEALYMRLAKEEADRVRAERRKRKRGKG